ncbi:MAG: tRNA lysidine(34) synthetase TilS [Anaerolineae bacterium]
MSPVIDQVRLSIREHRLLHEGAAVVVGVSGGADSLCLLHVLCRLADELGLSLTVAHLHHGLRGAEADADARYVRQLAADWGLPCTLEQQDVTAIARRYGLAIEEAARRARYAFLGRVAEAVGARFIAVGHHADDQAETVLMHWIRGSGLAGLRGMLPRTRLGDYRLLGEPVPGKKDLWLIRPMLETTRSDIEAYCLDHGLTPRFDRSNLDTTYFRNWLRHTVIPLLEEHNPNFKEVIRRTAHVITDDYALLRSLLAETWPRVVVEESVPDTADAEAGPPGITFDLEAWRGLPAGLQRSTLREAIHRLRRSLRNINFVHVENAVQVAQEGPTGAQSTLPRGLVLRVGYRHLTVTEAGSDLPVPDWPLLPDGCHQIPVLLPGVTAMEGSGWVLRSSVMDARDLPADWEANPDPWRAFLDLRSIGARLWLRTRQPGDRFQPLGMGGHAVKLADFLTNQKVPRSTRDRLPLLVAEWGICWVCGQRIDTRARVHGGTQQILFLRFERDPDAG